MEFSELGLTTDTALFTQISDFRMLCNTLLVMGGAARRLRLLVY